MSIKDLFDKNYLAETKQKDAFSDVESADNFKALAKKKNILSQKLSQQEKKQNLLNFHGGSLALQFVTI